MTFSSLNENGRINDFSGSEGRFRFSYSNQFYGSGTFHADVVRRGPQDLMIVPRVDWEEMELRSGNEAGLRRSALAFFSQRLNQAPPPKPRAGAGVRGNLGLFQSFFQLLK